MLTLKKVAENHGLTKEGVDYALSQYQIIIYEITHGMLSKLSYDAHDVLACADDPDRVRVVRCRDCRFWKPNNAEEGDASGTCMNWYSPAGTTDMNWFCADGEREE